MAGGDWEYWSGEEETEEYWDEDSPEQMALLQQFGSSQIVVQSGATEEQAASRVVWRGRWELPRELEARHIAGRLGVARCRAARACRGLRAAVAVAKDLGAFRHKVQALAAGERHTVVCTGDAVFSFGQGGHGQLGYDEAGCQTTPREVAGLLAEDVVAAAASAFSTLVCTAKGRAYWFGALVHQSDRILFAQPAPGLLGGLERVVGVAAGEIHLLAWTGSGELYTWGYGEDGQLGHGGHEHEAAPRLVEGLAGQQVVGADGGWRHSVARTASGRLYTWGYGEDGQLGHGGHEHEAAPRLVEGLAGSTVVAVAAATNITVAVTEAGELYTWGVSYQGAQGHGQGDTNTHVFLPRLVAGLAGRRVAGVAAGDHHTLAWTDSGELYSWGWGCNGQLGHNFDENEWSPRRVEGLAGKVVVGAAAGSEHSVVRTQKQEVYTFGEGGEGQLGHGSAPAMCEKWVPTCVAGLRTP